MKLVFQRKLLKNRNYVEVFGDTPPVVEDLLDEKALKANENKKRKGTCKKVQILEEQLEKKEAMALDSEKAKLQKLIRPLLKVMMLCFK